MNKLYLRLLIFVLLIMALPAGISIHAQDERGTLRTFHQIEWGGAESLDPLSPYSFWEINGRLYSRLIRADGMGGIEPELATEWSSNEDSTVWTLKIREGVKFHDGKDLTATDVVFTLNHILDPDVESPVLDILSIVDSVEAPDDSTVVISLSISYADLPLILSDPRIRILPDDSEEPFGIGTGPFKLETLDIEGITVLVANDDYWEGAPKMAGIEVYPIPDAQAAQQATLAGQIDIYEATVQETPLFADANNFYVQYIPTGDWEGIIFNTTEPPFDDVRVRRAMRLLANRQDIVDLVLGENGGVVACDTPVYPADQYYLQMDCEQDLEQAKQLLTDAGYGDGLDVELYLSDISQRWTPFAEVYQQAAAQVGVNINLNFTSEDGYWADVWMIEPVAFTWWTERPADIILNESFRSGADWNETYYSNPDFDALLDSARSAPTLEERKELFGQAQEMLYEDGGAFIPYFMSVIRIVNSDVEGLPPLAFDYVKWHEVSINR